MAPSISTEIDIKAPPSAVWEVLTDYDRYPDWNPFLVKLCGDKKAGGQLVVSLKPAKDSSGMTFSPVIQTFIPNEHFHWRGRLLNVPWLFTGHHHFKLHPIENGTRFEQFEQFSGILALALGWVGSGMYENTESRFRLMNDALKGRVEGNRSSDKVLKPDI